MRTMALFILILHFLLWPATIFAQDDMPEPQMIDPGPPPPGLVVPIDSNIEVLLVLGLLFGGIYILKFRRNTQ